MKLADGNYQFVGTDPAQGYNVTVSDGGNTLRWGDGEPPVILHWDDTAEEYIGDPPSYMPRVDPHGDGTYWYAEEGHADYGTYSGGPIV